MCGMSEGSKTVYALLATGCIFMLIGLPFVMTQSVCEDIIDNVYDNDDDYDTCDDLVGFTISGGVLTGVGGMLIFHVTTITNSVNNLTLK